MSRLYLILLLILFLLPIHLIRAQATRPDNETSQRQESLRQALRALILESGRAGHWPDRVPATGLSYRKPPDACLTDLTGPAYMVVILHEPPAPTGSWVGYADGFAEFVSDEKALAAALQRSDRFLAAARPAPPSPAQLARMARGQALQKILLETLETAYANDSVWPQTLPAGTPWLYTRPRDVSDALIATAVVAMHEPLGAHPDGAWVGYADGHLEFAADAAAFAACQDQQAIARRAVVRRDELASPAPTTTSATRPAAVTGSLPLRMLDSAGRPVAHAAIGQFGVFGDMYPDLSQCFFIEGERRSHRTLMSDAEGRATVEASQVFAVKFTDSPIAPLWVYHHDRQLAALDFLTREAFSVGSPRDIRLQPTCRVTCDISSVGLQAIGKQPFVALGEVSRPGESRLGTFECQAIGSRLEFFLPPGEYGMSVRSASCNDAYRFLRIEPGRREMHLQIDLVPETVTRLVGQPAPALRNIKGWKGTPVSLEDLRGKVVLLDFWGFWCGPCIGQMPALFKLHDQFKEKGLVIVGIHDDSVASTGDLDEKLVSIRRDRWNNRDIPFPVALDGGGESRVPMAARRVRGATTAAYGINAWPTTLLIGKDGTVVGSVEADSDRAQVLIERLLAN